MIPAGPADLADNREGRLSPAQRAAYEAMFRRARSRGWILLAMAVTFVVASAIVPNVHHRVLGLAVAAGVDAVLIALVVWGWRRLGDRALRRLRDDRVEHVVGVLTHVRRSQYGRSYYVRFGERTLGAPVDLIAPIRGEPEQRPHRVYFLAGTEDVIAIEPA